jgi:hypothetical protein
MLVQKKIEHYDGCKKDYLKNHRQHKYPKYDITTQIKAISQPNTENMSSKIHFNSHKSKKKFPKVPLF